MTTIDLKSKFTELDARRTAAVQVLDAAIEDIRALLDLDKHLVRLGLQDAHQLEHEQSPNLGSHDEVRERAGLAVRYHTLTRQHESQDKSGLLHRSACGTLRSGAGGRYGAVTVV